MSQHRKKNILSILLIISGVLGLAIMIYFRVFSFETKHVMVSAPVHIMKMGDKVASVAKSLPQWKVILDFFFSYLKEAMSVATSAAGIWMLIKNNKERRKNG